MEQKRKGRELRERIVSAANRLFYTRGFNQTSFSDIAVEAGIPRGNFYYHFRSKDEILEAVVEMRMEAIRAMLAEWDATIPDPRDRLKRFVRILHNDEQDILRYGCPLGSLSEELGKVQLRQQSRAGEMFLLFRDWMKRQFQALGCGRTARDHAHHLLAVSQGASVLAHATGDSSLLRKEAARLRRWLDEL